MQLYTVELTQHYQLEVMPLYPDTTCRFS